MKNCEDGIQKWRDARVDYPGRLTLELGSVASYIAAVDIRENAILLSEVIPGQSPESAPAAVKCRVAARLVPIGDAVEVNPPQDEWVNRFFTPSGVVNWAWTVKAVKPGRQELRLELQPAVVATDGGYVLLASDSIVGNFITSVEIDTSAMDDLKQWFEKTWGVIAAISAALAAAIIAFVRWSGEIGQALREARAKWQGTPESRDADTEQRESTHRKSD